MVFYRKYRPQIIDDLDSEYIRQTLRSVLKKRDSTAHAFLFTGPKGLGKTSTARIVAKVVNCTASDKERKDGIEPCGQCDQCVSIQQGNNVDILEIDAASNRGIDEIRDLKEKIRLSPVAAYRKVYIIDEVHMLTTEAFNALLKTLEEPPAHAMFILCTTEPSKVPATIVSRCFHLAFKLAIQAELVRSFKRIARDEKISIDDDALRVLCELSDGGFRDGVKMLEELVSLSNGKKITQSFIEETYKLSHVTYQVSHFLNALKKKNSKEALEIIQTIIHEGVDMKHFIQELIKKLHELLLVNSGIAKQEFREKELTLSSSEITHLFQLLSQAYADMKYAVLPQLPLELACISYCMKEDEQEILPSVEEDKGVSLSALRKKAGNMAKIKTLYGDTSVKSATVSQQNPQEEGVDLLHASPNGEVTKEWQDMLWKHIIHEMKQYNHTIAGVLRGCTIGKYDKKVLIIETAYKFHKEKLEEMKVQQELNLVCRKLTGNELTVKVELKETQRR